MTEYLKSTTLLLTLLNPFLVIIYLVDLVQKLEQKQFVRVLIRAGLIAGSVCCCFAILGDTIFSGVMQVEFASFQIFGGIAFLLIEIQFVFLDHFSIGFIGLSLLIINNACSFKKRII